MKLSPCQRAIVFLLVMLVAFASVSAGASDPGANQAEEAWQQITPDIERFWKDLENSPALVKRSAWPLINSLKFYIQYYPKSPHIAQAYYLLGEAYSAVSYGPEAAAHWKTVVKYYPSSKWAGPALTALVRQLELKGNRQNVLKFYKKILSQFPDSTAARMAMVLLAEDALRQGKIKTARLTAERLSRVPSIELEVPEFLRLKAMLAEQDGDYATARRYLLHYINLVKSRQMRASALFSIAESYRKEGQLLKARKYYAFIRRDYESEPEALFSRFRLAQIEDITRGRMSRYIGSGLKPENLPATARLYAKILKKYPDHPLTQEVQLELIRLRIRQGRYLDAVKLGNNFLKRYPESVYLAMAEEETLKAIDLLEKHTATLANLKDALEFCLPFVKHPKDDPVAARIAGATPVLWKRLLEMELQAGEFEDALEQYRHFTQVYGPGAEKEPGKSMKILALRALKGLDEKLLSTGGEIRLINYHYTYIDMMKLLSPASHWVALAKAWEAIECPEAALRAYYRAWQLKPAAGERCSMLVSWADAAIRNRDTVTGSAVMELLDSSCPDLAFTGAMLEKKARLQLIDRKWQEANGLFRDAVREGGGLSAQTGLLETSIMTGDWETARKLRRRIWSRLTDREKSHFLRLWGDEAFRLQQYEVARDAFQRLLALEPEEPSVAWRVARTMELTGHVDDAMNEYKVLSQAKEPLWAAAADAALKNREFWNRVPEDLR